MKLTYFQYRPGVVSEARRVIHCRKPPDAADSPIWESWCGQRFDRSRVEETAEPGTPVEPGQAPPTIAGAPCVRCLLLVTASTSQETATTVEAVGTIEKSDKKLILLLRRAQWLLDDAAYIIPKGRCDSEDYQKLAETLRELAKLLTERAKAASQN